MANVKTFTISYTGLQLLVTATENADGTTSFTITCVSGSADVNALYWNDGDNVVDGGTLLGFDAKKDSSLNMNGSGEVWDGGIKLSSTGLGSLGINKPTYLTAGETYNVGTVNVDWDTIQTIGLRATSTSTADGSIKGVADSTTNVAPVAHDDTLTTKEDTPATINVLANDSDADGDTLTIVGTPTASHGTVIVNADQTITYTPAADYNGTDTISYTISDGQGHTATASVAVTVTEVNDAPTANSDTATVEEDSSGNVINVLGNDSKGPANESGQALTVTAATAGHGTVTINSDGTLSYTPDADYNGPDTINYTIQDNGTTNGAADPKTSSSTVAVSVREVNDAPTANSDTATVEEDSSGNIINVLGNDSKGPANENGQTLTVTAATAGHGTVTINGDGTLSYTPDTNYNGPDTITYTIQDDGTTDGSPDPRTSSSSVEVTVTEVNDAPHAGDDTATAAEDTPLNNINVLSNDSAGPANESGQTLTVIGASALHGTVSINGDGTLNYTPGADYNGSDTITYTIQDNGTTNGAADPRTDVGEVAITVTEVNDAPHAVDDTATTAEDTPLNNINVLSNDSAGPANESGQTLTVIGAAALHGTVSINGDGTLNYTPGADYNGSDTITYTIQDNGTTNGAADPKTDVGEVAVTITPVNDAPRDIGFIPTDDGSNLTPGHFTATDPEGQTVHFSVGSASDSGVHIAADGTLSVDGGLAGTTQWVNVRASDGTDFTETKYTILIGTPVGDTMPGVAFVLAPDDNILIGRNGADPMTGSSLTDYILGGNSADTINGGAGNDVIVGGSAADLLTGGAGQNVFKYISTGDSSVANPDTITDWNAGDNKIDLSMVDANSGVSGDQAFAWGGTSATANGVWVTQSGADTIVHVDTNGNTGADEMNIILSGVTATTLDASDFIL